MIRTMKFKSFFQRRSSGEGAVNKKKGLETPFGSPVPVLLVKDEPPSPVSDTEKSEIVVGDAISCKKCGETVEEGEDLNKSLNEYKEKLQLLEIQYKNLHDQYGQVCDALNYEAKKSGKQKAVIEKLEQGKLDVTEYRKLLESANVKINEVTTENIMLKSELAKNETEMEKLTRDFLLCISSAERFRCEAEEQRDSVLHAFEKLKGEVETLKLTHAAEAMQPQPPPLPSQPPPSALVPSNDDVAFPDGVNKSDLFEPPEIRMEKQEFSFLDSAIPTSKSEKADETFSNDMESVCENLEETFLHLDKDFIQVQRRRAKSNNFEDKLSILRKHAGGSLRNGLLKWCQEKTKDYRSVDITNFSSSWKDGVALLALIHSFEPSQFNFNQHVSASPEKNFKLAVASAKHLGVGSELAVRDILYAEYPPWDKILKYVTDVYTALG